MYIQTLPNSKGVMFVGDALMSEKRYIYTDCHCHYHVNIQGDPGGKVSILGGDSIGHCKKYMFI